MDHNWFTINTADTNAPAPSRLMAGQCARIQGSYMVIWSSDGRPVCFPEKSCNNFQYVKKERIKQT